MMSIPLWLQSCYSYFQQNNVSCHKAQIISIWFLEHNNEFTNPKQSTNLNLIEQLWECGGQRLTMDVQPTTPQQLSDVIMSIWTKISWECNQHLVESMTQNIVAALKEKGGPTLYKQVFIFYFFTWCGLYLWFKISSCKADYSSLFRCGNTENYSRLGTGFFNLMVDEVFLTISFISERQIIEEIEEWVESRNICTLAGGKLKTLHRKWHTLDRKPDKPDEKGKEWDRDQMKVWGLFADWLCQSAWHCLFLVYLTLQVYRPDETDTGLMYQSETENIKSYHKTHRAGNKPFFLFSISLAYIYHSLYFCLWPDCFSQLSVVSVLAWHLWVYGCP